MKVIGINGSPRKNWNTDTLVNHAISGAKKEGADVELFHLYDLNYKGCTSCFACKTVNGKHYGRCAMKDDLSPVLDKIDDADAIIIGSPVYFWSISGETRSFLERLLFPYSAYTNPPTSLVRKKKKVGFIYTMNIDTDERLVQTGIKNHLQGIESFTKRILGHAESLYSMNTYQFPDYSKVVFEYMDVKDKEYARKNIFPQDCQKAYELGRRLVEK